MSKSGKRKAAVSSNMDNGKNITEAKAGDTIVVYGKTRFDRELVNFTDAKALVAYFRERDDYVHLTNEDYMSLVEAKMREVVGSSVLPYHNEEAFVAGLFRLGLCATTTLN